MKRFAPRLGPSHLVPEKIVFAQGESQFLGSHVEQFKELFVGKKVPVAPEVRDVTSFYMARLEGLRCSESHRCSYFRNPRDIGAQHLREAGRLDCVPVAEDKGMKTAGKVLEYQRVR